MVRAIFFIIMVICSFWTGVFADELISEAIDSYKNGDIKNCILKSNQVVQADPTFALGYYYLGLSYTRTGEKELALNNYNKVIALGSDKTLTNLAKLGKSKLSAKESNKKVTGVETILEEIDDTTEKGLNVNIIKNESVPQKPVTTEKQTRSTTAETSPVNNKMPTNDEIVNAIRVLQKAGLLQNGLNGLVQQQQPQQQQQYSPQNYMDPRTQEMQAMLMMMNSGNNNNYNNNNDMMNMLPYMQGGKMSPQMIQMMMMKQMTPDFSSGNNNGY